MKRALLTAGLLLFAAIATAQTPPVTYTDDFQSWGKSKKPDGWIDGKVGDLSAKPRGYYKTALDPLGGNKATNIVFGTTKSTGSEDDEKKARIGWFSTYVDKTFSAAGRFEIQGRLIEMSQIGRFGLVVLSGYPQTDAYYLIGEKRDAAGNVRLQAMSFGAGTPTGTTESNQLIERGKWYRFRLSVDDANNATTVRARFWLDGTPEPSTYQIEASDTSPSRLKSGHFGLWSGGRGDADNGTSDDDGSKGFFVDDLNAHSPSDTTPPVISFYESGNKLDPATTPAFNRDAKIEIRVTDDLSTFTYSAQLDGNPYVSLTPVTVEGVHTITVHAVDAPGNARDATLKFLVDKTQPVIALLANGSALDNGAIFSADVTLSATVQDISAVKTTATLDGGSITLPLPVAQEKLHAITVTATDAAGNSSSVTRSFTVDKSAPAIAILANGSPLASGASFGTNVTLTWTATDLTLDTVSATLDTNSAQSGAIVTAEGPHVLVVTAKDKAGHTTTETRNFALDKTAPEVTLLANGVAFETNKTYNTAVRFTLVVHDATPTTKVITVDGNPYTEGNPVTGDGPHTIKVVVTNSANISTTVGPFDFVIDTVKPEITMTESGQPFQDGAKFTRDVLPIVTATDALTAHPAIVVTLDGKPYPANTAINEEKADHVISATATDAGGNSASVGPFHFMLDKSKPVVTIADPATGQPFAPDALFNVPVSVKITVTDVTKTTVAATLDGASFSLGAPSAQPDGSVVYTPGAISAEGAHALSVVATDEVGFSNDPATAAFTVDMTPPHITFTDPAPDATVSALTITVSGTADDAQTITINGRAAEVNTASKTFTIGGVTLLEGRNELAAVATDAAGNRSTPTLVVTLDTRAPEVVIISPAADSCVDATTLEVRGTVSDPHVSSVNVTVGAASLAATVDNGAWVASIAVPDEGKKLITVEAADTLGHTTSVSRYATIDRGAPAVDIIESGAPFTRPAVNRAVSLFVRVTDADPAVAIVAKLDGSAYVSGTPITVEGSHTLAVTATDCAGHSTAKSATFLVDLTPPAIRNLNPANGGTAGTMPTAISGVTDPDAVNVEVSGTPFHAAPAADGSFTIAGVPFAEGSNRFALVATDRAGNSFSLDYTVTVKTIAPVVEIRESGLPIPEGSLFNRTVTPVIRSNDPSATVAATLDGAVFASGTTITADGNHKLSATATDALGHAGTAEVNFTIDRTPPTVKITAPVTGTVQTDHVQIRGTAGDAVSASVNGQPVDLAADGSFVVDPFQLEVGQNQIVATGRDRAGNVGRDQVIVTRDDLGAAVLITYPPDRSLTNRITTDVVGRIFPLGHATSVTIGSTTVTVDPTGEFRISGYPLVEGENTITATSTAINGVQSTASTHVTADFTPPSLTILESGQPLVDSARFATQAVITLQSADVGGGTVTTTLTIDGTKTATTPATINTAGGHSVIAVARDLAGNETRAERTLFIGTSAGGTADCKLDGFDPANGAVVLANSATVVGRSGGAIGVKVNGVAATVADGAFWATVELPAEGPNTVNITCTDAAGNPTGTPATLMLQRVTGDPSITITAPDESFVSAQESIAVSGTVGAGVVSADVNGVAATINGTAFTVPAVRLAPGLNMIVAHGRNAAGRVATASRRGLYLKDAPSVSISAPSANTTTGTTKITVSGTYANLDPTTLVAGSTPAQYVRQSDTTGTFAAADVPLNNGANTLTVSGRDRLNRSASASVIVNLVSGTPSISIAQPADHANFDGGATSVNVSGTFQAAAGATVDVNGVAATLSGSSFTASAPFSTLGGGITPIVARVTEPSGASASTAIVVTQLTAAPTVLESFPAPNAVEVDNGALLLVLFSQPMDVAAVTGGFRLEDGNGTPVSGTLYLDKDVLTFARATLLTPGARYTMRVTTAAKNLAGMPLAAEYTSAFTTAGSAPSTAPVVNPLGAAVCGQSITISGTATPGARVRLESGALTLDAAADATGKFSFTYPISGQSGFALVRVRTVGSDGSVSPAAELEVRIDCSGPQVMSAAYDRSANKLTIQFSEPIDATSATVGAGNAITLSLEDGRSIAGTATINNALVTVTPAEDLSAKTFSLTVTTAIKDKIGNHLVSAYSQSFAVSGDTTPVAGDGTGFISGEVYDATTGRPLPSAAITIEVPAKPPVTTATDARGRYVARLPEGAHTIKASLSGYTSVWREIIVPAGAGVVPIDIRLTKRGDPTTSNGSAIALTHGGDTTVTKKADLTIPGGALAGGRTISLTAVGAQALTGLLPLGWSPIASAEVSVDGSDASVALSGAQLTFTISAAEVTAAAQNLTAVSYDATRDEWRVLASVANVGADGKVVVPVSGSGAYALVYADKAAGLTAPPLPTAGDVLRGVPAAPADAPALVKRDFLLNPSIILPTGRAVATLRIEGGTAKFPSGTAVQAYVDEELRLADGSRLLDPPFATDLLLYRTLAGDLGVADFHLGPSAKAAQVVLETGVDHVHIQPYPGRLDRGTLIGSEGGRVPADDKVAIDVPSGAVPEPLRATATSMTSTDLAALGTIAGFRVVGGFQLALQRVTEPAPVDLDGDGKPDPVAPVELFVPARATFTADASKLPAPSSQVILAELLDVTPYGRMLRLAAPMAPVDLSQTSTPAIRFATKTIDRSILPVDGIVHEGRYVLLAAEAPIAFATGTVHSLSATGRLMADARVLAPPLGVAELTRSTGIYNIPVPAAPSAPFTLVPRHTSTGDGAAYTHPTSPAADAVVRVDLTLIPQPPVLSSVVVLKGDPPSQGTLTAGAVTTDVALTTNVRASYTPGIDPASVTGDSITVTDVSTGAKVSGSAAADGTVAVIWTLTAGQQLKPNGVYVIAIAGTIRGSNGALAHGATFTVATVKQVLNSEIHRERIRITMPDAGGVSRITGDPGALPAGWQALAVRRKNDFIVRYQGTAAADGSFAFFIGNGGDAADKITIADLIDLRVVNTNGTMAGIFALTPFVSEDGKSFVVPAGEAVRYTTPEGITLDVPEGAFDVPTIVSVAAAKKEDFLDVPSLEAENEYAGSVKIDFDGVANKPLVVEMAVPAGFDTTGKQFILAQKGDSVRGPRLAVIDLMRVENGKFTNAPDPNRTLTVFNAKVHASQTLTGSQFSKYLMMLIRSGIYMTLDIKQPVGGSVGWAAMEGLQASYDLMWDIFASYYIPHIAITERGGALLPIITGKKFTVVGVDPGTGLQAFSRTYDPIPNGEPGTVVPIEPAQQNDGGPYPTFTTPARIEVIDLDVEDVDIKSVRNFSLNVSHGGNVQVSPSGLDANTRIEVLNVTKGTMSSGTGNASITLAGKIGDRLVLLIEEHDVDASTPISIAFNEPVWTSGSTNPDDVDKFLHNLFTVEQAPEPVAGTPSFSDVTAQARFTVDSGGRRINVSLLSALQREAVYRVTLKPDIADVFKNAAGLKLGQGTIDNGGVLAPTGGGNALHLIFHTRKPAGPLNTFTAASSGIIRGMDLSGNVLFLAALDGGLLTFDMSNPAVTPPPLGYVGGQSVTGVSHLSVTIDRHNRVYTTVATPAAGNFRSYRVEDFLNGGSVTMKGSSLINWRIGLSQDLGLPSNTMLSDIPESIPYSIKVVLQDDETNFKNRQEFIAGASAAKVADYPDDLQKFTATIGKDGTPYAMQRITIENLTLDMRWSADATDNGPAVIQNIVARSGDRLRLIRNQKTFAIVAHLGYGIGVYDANGIESNRFRKLSSIDPQHFRENLVLTAGKIARECPNATPDFGIVEDYITLDAELRGDETGTLYSYSTDSYRGVLDLRLRIPSTDGAGTRDDDCDQRPTPNDGGLLFRSAPDGHEVPRIRALRDAFAGAAGREPYNHFFHIAQYHWAVNGADNKLPGVPGKGLRGTFAGEDAERDYLLVAGWEYGLIVVDINGNPPVVPPWPASDANVADVIWIPGGAMSVRVYQNENIAVVGDGYGRVVLVDLSRIDERWDDKGNPTTGLFPTAKKALSVAASDPYGVGGDDPRIIWKSQTGVIGGTLAPVFDTETGMVYAGAMVDRTIKTLSAIDPRLRVRANLGDAGGLTDVGGIVPLGVAPSKSVEDKINGLPACGGTTTQCKENASLGAFRLEVALPGNIVDNLTNSSNELQLAVESERVTGAITEQTPNGLPRAHLRRTRRDGSAETGDRAASSFQFKRIVPDELKQALKNQRGYNKFLSPWIVAIADPRASIKYDWSGATPQQKKDAGCEWCERPKYLQNLGEADGVFELYTNGRMVSVRPEMKSGGSQTIFDGTQYAYLAQQNRMIGRFGTIIADTVRPPEALVAAQNAPVATGNLQGTTFLHSGELENADIDLDAGGRNDFDVVFERDYRSRTIGGSALGQGWDSPVFQRLRALPNGDVEFRDGSEVWRYKANLASGGYDAPKGLFLKLTRSQRGWKMVDQHWRVTEFDDMGRVLARSDEFVDPQKADSGNVIHYLYDETGRLAQVVDPVKRVSTLAYWNESEATAQGAYPGLVKEITDWRQRKIDYAYDNAAGTLTKVQLPVVANTTGNRPTLQYAYATAGASFNDALELRGNLASVTDPQQVASGGGARVQYAYGNAGANRDHVVGETWGTGEVATFTYNSPTDVTTQDTLGQTRKYSLSVQPKDGFSDRAHVLNMVENGITVSSTPLGQLPSSVTPGVPVTTSADRSFAYTLDGEGLLLSEAVSGLRSTTYSYKNLQPEGPGFVLQSQTTTPADGSAPITESVTYQTGANRGSFVASISANGKTIESPEPNRNYLTVQMNNDGITTTDTYDNFGLLEQSVSSGGTDSGGGGSQKSIAYAGDTDAAHRRGLPTTFDTAGLKRTIDYASPDQTIETDARGVVTTTDFDSWHRPVHVVTAGPQQTMDQHYEYDATGRLATETRKQGTANVTTTYSYDVMGRPTAVTVDNVANVGAVTTSTNYDLRSRTVVMNHPGGAATTTKLDSLGRAVSRETTTGGAPISDYFAYDLGDNMVASSDLHTATATAYSGHGFAVGTMAADGTKTSATFDGWGRPTSIKDLDSAGGSVGETNYVFSNSGRLQSMATKVDTAQTRVTDATWDGGGRSTGFSASGRAVHTQFDNAGRIASMQAGGGTAQGVTNVFDESTVSGYDGPLPQMLHKKDKSQSAYSLALEYNTAAQVTTSDFGNLEWKRTYDEAGNPTSISAPNRPPRTYTYDSRGAIREEGLPGGGSNKFDYHPTGAMTNYTDPANEVTQTITDLIGRVVQRIYGDGTRETIDWDGRRVKTITDRQGRPQTFNYNEKGQIISITGAGGLVLDKIDYDAAGRIIRWSNDDAILEYSDFDFEGHPRKTKQTRVQGSTVIDQYTQEHTWNMFGERLSWTMPTYSGFTSASQWTTSVALQYDDVGNITSLRRTLFNGGTASFLDADYRGAGHPNRRTVHTIGGADIVRSYGYDSTNGLFNEMVVTANGKVVGGSHVTYDGVQKAKAQLFGVSGGARADAWQYDSRSRLKTAAIAQETNATPQAEELTAADFRTSLVRAAPTPVDPPSLSFTESTGGHKIAQIKRGLVVEQVVFNGSERSEDGKFIYQYDAKGRLILVTQKSTPNGAPLRRVRYVYDGNDRIVGRRAEYEATPGGWKVEDRTEILAADGLPAETTFVWDPMDDVLVAIFKTGASENAPADANGGLVRQIIHGGLNYDDPLEVAAADPAAIGGVARLYPIYDEAGAGLLQVILDRVGQIVSRNVAGGSYGEDQAGLSAAAVDNMKVTAKKGTDGKLVYAKVALRLTESIDPASLATGVRLAVVDAGGAVVRTATATPALVGEATAEWTLDSAAWAALIDPAPVVVGGKTLTPAALSIAVTGSLRASTWSNALPVLSAPAWALASKPVYTSPGLPVETRESLTNINQWINSTAAGEEKTSGLFEAPNLLSLATPRGEGGSADPQVTIVASPFHAHPFQEPITGKSFVRARWFDSQNGVWLTPDPAGYLDSANLYAYAGGDPVNKRDSNGEYEADVHRVLTHYLGLQAGFLPQEAISVAAADEAIDTSDASAPIWNGIAGFWNVVIHYHFAIEPGAKYVKRNTPTARHGVDTATTLRALGEGLHLLQDSYSHEDAYVGNIKDQYNKYQSVRLWVGTILFKDIEHGIGHPDKPAINSRADNHYTDQTWTDPDKAVEMAKVSFEAMVDYRVRTRAISAYEGNRIKQRWAEIEPSVRVFARARTKAEKERWRGMYATGVTFTPADLKDMTIDK